MPPASSSHTESVTTAWKNKNIPSITANSSRQSVYLSLGLPWPPHRPLSLTEGRPLAMARLAAGHFMLSPTQPDTPGQGNSCMFHALTDQLSYQPGLGVNSHSQLREMLVKAAYNSIKSGKLLWGCDGSLEDWRLAMRQEGTMGDQIILQAASNLFQRDIIILPVFRDAAHNQKLGITLISPSPPSSPSGSPLYLQYYSESRFLTPHFQSIRPLPNAIIHTGLEMDQEDDFISMMESLPDPPSTGLQNPYMSCDSSSFTSSSYSTSSSSTSSSSPSPSPSPSSSSSTSFSSSSSSSRASKLPDWYVVGSEVRGIGRQTRL